MIFKKLFIDSKYVDFVAQDGRKIEGSSVHLMDLDSKENPKPGTLHKLFFSHQNVQKAFGEVVQVEYEIRGRFLKPSSIQ